MSGYKLSTILKEYGFNFCAIGIRLIENTLDHSLKNGNLDMEHQTNELESLINCMIKINPTGINYLNQYLSQKENENQILRTFPNPKLKRTLKKINDKSDRSFRPNIDTTSKITSIANFLSQVPKWKQYFSDMFSNSSSASDDSHDSEESYFY